MKKNKTEIADGELPPLTPAERKAAITAITAVRGCGVGTAEEILAGLSLTSARALVTAEQSGKRVDAVPLLW